MYQFNFLYVLIGLDLIKKGENIINEIIIFLYYYIITKNKIFSINNLIIKSLY